MINKLFSLFTEKSFIVYAFIGVSGVLIDLFLYIVLVKFFACPPVLASVISVSAGIINNFFLNAHFNFKKRDHLLWRFLSFYAIGVTGLILSALLILLLHDIFGMDAITAKILTVVPIVLYQYWFNKNASFADSHKQVPWKQLAIFGLCVGVLVLFAVNAPYFSFTDEDDNLLGAQFLASGKGALYIDYFSHHMPLTYFMATPFFAILGNNLIAVMVGFGIAMGVWLLSMSRHIYNKFGMRSFALFTGLVAISQMLVWSHMLLGEVLVAFATTHALILFATRDKQVSIYREGIAYAILGAIPLLSALSYAPLSLLIYSLYIVTLVEKYRAKPNDATAPLLVFCATSLTPYIALLIYLYTTHSFTEFRYQVITFNTTYYSQFSPDAATGPFDGILSILQGAATSMKNSITISPLANPQPLSFLFSASIILSFYVFLKTRKSLLFAAFLVATVFGASRYGFSAVFSNNQQARAGIITAVVGVLTLVLAMYYARKSHFKKNAYSTLFWLVTTSTVILISISSISQIATTAREYVQHKSLVAPQQEPGSPSTVINLINETDDYYWIGPIDFSSQLFIDSKNSSKYRFFAPWIAKCESCTEELYTDLLVKKPKVIALDKNLLVWGHAPARYAPELISRIDKDYYQLPDNRLKNFYFDKLQEKDINERLGKAGYQL